MGLKDYSREQMQRMPMIELAHIILSEKKKAVHYSELYDQVAEWRGFTAEEKQYYLAQFYTDLTVDGRFITTGSSVWGLKRWYPVEQIDEEGIAPKKKKKKTTTAKKKTTTKKKAPKKKEKPEPQPEPDVPEDDLEVLTDKFEDEVHDDEEDYFGDFDEKNDDPDKEHDQNEDDDEHDEDKDDENEKK